MHINDLLILLGQKEVELAILRTQVAQLSEEVKRLKGLLPEEPPAPPTPSSNES